MSGFNGRRAPNVSQYIANLNTIPSAAETAAQPDFGAFQDDLDLFTNTQFFDFDLDESAPKMSGEIPFTGEEPRPQQQAQSTLGQSPKSINFVNQPSFQFPDFNFTRPQQHQRLPTQSGPPSPPNGLAAFPGQHQTSLAQLHQSYAPSPVIGEKRKSTITSLSSPTDFEEGPRMAAEEDKRRRNTAASARFRVKKKQREQALEKNAKDMSDKLQFLEARVGQLEMENKWLKGLITEKNLKTMETSSSSKSSEKLDSDLSSEQRKDGVGTENKADDITA